MVFSPVPKAPSHLPTVPHLPGHGAPAHGTQQGRTGLEAQQGEISQKTWVAQFPQAPQVPLGHQNMAKYGKISCLPSLPHLVAVI